jgi:glutamate formiminotransferase/formiminotetrahydrofolate cyclodeaminase
VTGSDIIGLIPLEAMISAGKYYLKKQKLSTGIPIKDIIHIAIKSLGLDDLAPFDPNEKIIENRINNQFGNLTSMKIRTFSDELSSNSPAPGGGSASALAGVLGASLTSMVANLTTGKKKWAPLYKQMCKISENSQRLKDILIQLIDMDTDAFNFVLETYKLPKKTVNQTKVRDNAIDLAMKQATDIPFQILTHCKEIIYLAIETSKFGNPNSISDAGVAGEMAHAGAHSATLNILINLKEIKDTKYSKQMFTKTNMILSEIDKLLISLRLIVSKSLDNA